jgi:Flp pilus assembly protein CpaB
MRRIVLLIGALLAVIVAVGIFLFWRFSQPKEYQVPVAITDIPAGTVIRPNLFRVVTWKDLDKETLDTIVTVDNFTVADGKVTGSNVRAGFPLAKSQVDPNASTTSETRLSEAITRTNAYYFVLPVTPDSLGNYVQPGDRIDLLMSIGDAAELRDLKINRDGELLAKDSETEAFVPVLAPPISKMVMQNLKVLRVDREQTNTNNNNNNQSEEERLRRARAINDVKRIYVEVDKLQLEVLSFAINNGKQNFAVRASNAGNAIDSTEGVTWNDFVKWFMTQRGNQVNSQSFEPAGPYEPAKR